MATRRSFVRTLLLTAGGLGLLVVGGGAVGCGDDDGGGGGGGDDDAGGGGGCTSPDASIGSNHGHAMTVARADVDAGVNKTYDITGSAGHPHSVTLTAAHFTTLAGGGTVNVDSTSGGGHTHPITVTCA